MNIKNELKMLCETLNLNDTELSKELGVTYETINNWKNNRKTIDESNLEKFYSYAYVKGLVFNNINEQLIKEEYQNKDNVILFHGAKKTFSLPVDFEKYSKNNNDFGLGFYLGETFEQASNYISFINMNKVFCFCLNLNELNIYRFSVDTEWMITIAYFRGWLDKYKETSFIKNILDKLNGCDVIIAPIADNRMFDIITEFVEGTITDEQCKHALAATNLGFQYVIRTKKASDQLSFIKEMFLCQKEKDECLKKRNALTNNGLQKVKMARIEYKGKGKYIEEFLK